jgi:hypothetical protein
MGSGYAWRVGGEKERAGNGSTDPRKRPGPPADGNYIPAQPDASSDEPSDPRAAPTPV